MNTYHVVRVVTASKRSVSTRWHLFRTAPDGTVTLLRKYIRMYEAENTRDQLNRSAQERQAA